MILSDDEVRTQEVKTWKGLHLLHFWSSSCSQKVRVLLREKGIPYESHPIDLARQKHVSPWYLGINPRGVVPTLVHDGVVHVESNDILEYLDSQVPSDVEPFFPQNEEERAWVKENLDLEDSLHVHLRNLTMGFLMPKSLAKKSEATLRRYEKEGAENPKRAQEVKWWRDFAERGIPPEVARASAHAHREVFEKLDARLAASDWLIGDRRSVLDIAWFITTTRLKAAGYPLVDHPNLLRWHEALERRPAFAEETRDPFVIGNVVVPIYRAFRQFRGTTMLDVMA